MKSVKAGFFRKLKRLLRAKVDWNNWTLKGQLRTHLISMVLAFFSCHFIFLILTTWFQYQSTVASKTHDSIIDVFAKKLNFTSDAITLCF
jgi:hypothetical protein